MQELIAVACFSFLSTVLQAAANAFLKAPGKKKETGSGKSKATKNKDASK